MVKGLITTLLLTASLFADLDWAENYTNALKQAKQENKKVLIMFSREDCDACNKMKAEVYTDTEVVNYVTTFFIPVEIDMEYDSREGFKVYATPTYYFLDAEGKQIGRAMVGGADANAFLKKLREVESTGK
jgi:thioredoxin-related protein